MRTKFAAEWRRLNPRYVPHNATLWQAFTGAARETVPGFFAPLRLLWWFLRGGWR